MSSTNDSVRCLLDLLGDQLSNFTESFAIVHIYDQIISNADVLRVVQELEKQSSLLVWQNLYFLNSWLLLLVLLIGVVLVFAILVSA